MFKTLVNKVIGSKHDRTMKKLQPLVASVGAWEKRMEGLSDAELVAKTAEFKGRVAKGESLDKLLPEAFAVVRIASQRILGMRPYDVQLVGGIVLHQGKIAEMRTGEGKTLTSTLPLYLNALDGNGAHLVTVNSYLAERDAKWMGQIYQFLGLTVGVTKRIEGEFGIQQKTAAYAADITYGTNSEFGFDYLRDNMKFSKEDEMQRGLSFAIVDEVDSILIDEARTPLIISGASEATSEMYDHVNGIITRLNRDEHYIVDEEHRSVTLTDEGVDAIEAALKIDELYDPVNLTLVHHVNKAMEAHTLYRKDERYMIRGDDIVIIDEFTGRPMPGRRWSDGLHQAVEAKENVPIKKENVTQATMTYQNYFRMYDKLAGMTGTAETEAEEFGKIYELDVVVIPTNRPIIRKDAGDIVYRAERDKFGAIVEQILECYERGQPVLVGTVSVDKSEVISKVLTKKGIEHTVLNAKQHGREAGVVAQAGRKGSITIATNMAGRGTDIVLGGDPDKLAFEVAPDMESPAYKDAHAKFLEICTAEKEEVLAAGGLFILGTERHDSRRIDNQLRGRSGRQGDPGASQFFLSLEDELMVRFGAGKVTAMMDRLKIEDDGQPIDTGLIGKLIENNQKQVEGRNFDVRKHLLEYDDVMDVQRKTIYELRGKVISGEGMKGLLLDVLDASLADELEQYCSTEIRVEDWDIDALVPSITWQFNIPLERDELPETRIGIERVLWPRLEEFFDQRLELLNDAAAKLCEEAQRQADVIKAKVEAGELPDGTVIPEVTTPEEQVTEVLRRLYLRLIDQNWRDHLNGMQGLRDSVRLHGYAQKDPKHAYKAEGFDLFHALGSSINQQVARGILRLVPRDPLKPVQPPTRQRVNASQRARFSSGGIGAASAAANAAGSGNRPALPKTGRNEPCWCGSGKKYKHCHLAKDRGAAEEMKAAGPRANVADGGDKPKKGVSII
jgi:preprotein translocase subunit SecA